MPEYKLYYFNIRGLADPIRLTLVQAGVPFEDVRINLEEWPQWKEKLPFGQVPVLETENGKQLTQSLAILRYIARKYNLEPDNEWDRAVCDELATSWVDMFMRVRPGFLEKDKDKRNKIFSTDIEEFVKPRLKIFDERLSHSKHGFTVGEKVTWADFYIYNIFYMIKTFLKVSFEPYPHVDKFFHKIEALPNIKEWQTKHPTPRFSIVENAFE